MATTATTKKAEITRRNAIIKIKTIVAHFDAAMQGLEMYQAILSKNTEKVSFVLICNYFVTVIMYCNYLYKFCSYCLELQFCYYR